MERKSYRKYTIIISILCILLIAVNIVNISLAYFTDKATTNNSSFATFGSINIDAYFIDSDSNVTDDFTFSSRNVQTGSQIVRKIGIKNMNNAEKCAVRMFYKFEISKDGTNYTDVSSQNYLQLTTANTSNWKTKDKYFYYNSSLDKGESLEETITFTVTDKFGKDSVMQILGTSDLSTIKYQIKLCCDAVQVVNGGPANEWSGKTPDGWVVS